MAEKLKSQDNEEIITINIQPFLLPVSILLSAIILGTSLFFGLNNISNALGGTGVSKGTNNSDTVDDVATDDNSVVTEGVTDIDDDPILGNKDKAKVAIVEFSDYECPFCQRFHTDGTYDQIVENFIDSGEAIFVYRDFPLSFHEPAASKAANAANCINELEGEDAYYKFASSYFDATATNGQGISESKMTDLATKAGAKADDFNKCLDAEKFTDEIANDTKEGGEAGVTGTPGFIVGVLKEDGTVDGEVVSGAQPYSVFEAAIQRQLDRI